MKVPRSSTINTTQRTAMKIQVALEALKNFLTESMLILLRKGFSSFSSSALVIYSLGMSISDIYRIHLPPIRFQQKYRCLIKTNNKITYAFAYRNWLWEGNRQKASLIAVTRRNPWKILIKLAQHQSNRISVISTSPLHSLSLKMPTKYLPMMYVVD